MRKNRPPQGFTHPRRDAETWHYYLYLASLDTPGAYEKLEAKIAATANGNDWATLDGSNNVVPYAAYTANTAPATWAADQNVNLTAGGLVSVATLLSCGSAGRR